jgi:hypothetical protein
MSGKKLCSSRESSESLEGSELKNVQLGDGAIERLPSKLHEMLSSFATFDLSPRPFIDPRIDSLYLLL